jgi:hypothetical protein
MNGVRQYEYKSARNVERITETQRKTTSAAASVNNDDDAQPGATPSRRALADSPRAEMLALPAPPKQMTDAELRQMIEDLDEAQLKSVYKAAKRKLNQ